MGRGRGLRANPRTVKVRRSEEALNFIVSAITVTVSDISSCWDWVLQVITAVFHFNKCLEFRPIGLERAMLYTRDEKVTKQIVDTEAIVEKDTLICFSLWNTEVQTLDKECFTK